MNEKTFKTIDELIDLLISRGIDISTTDDINYAKSVLRTESYYNLINGYNKLFLEDASANTFKNGTKLQEIYALYRFDRAIRNIFFRYVLAVEANIKNLTAYYFSEKYGHDNYLLYKNFNISLKNAHEMISDLIADIQRQIASRSSDPSISHYLREYGHIPLWVLNNILTLGTISKFYSLMKIPERQSVSRVFNILDNDLENVLLYLTSIRNFCAHGNRLYCYRAKRPILDTTYHDLLHISKNSKDEYTQGKRDLFAAVIVLKKVLSKNEFKRMTKEIYKAIGILNSKLSVITQDDILNEMGFPNNWRTLDRL